MVGHLVLWDTIDPGNAGGSVVIPEWPRPVITPDVFACQVCGKKYASKDDLFGHRFEAHPFRRPALFLDGREVTSPRHLLVKPLLGSGLAVAHADALFLNTAPVSKDELIHALSAARRGLYEIDLEKDGIKTHYELAFEIPDAKELEAVDKLFFSLMASATLDVAHINSFIEVTTIYQSAQRYVDGLSHYLYGILAKDQKGGTILQLNDFKTKFNQALGVLRLFDSPLARIVAGIICFNQNTFEIEIKDTLQQAPKLKNAFERFCGFIDKNFAPSIATAESGGGIKNVPLDHSTDQILEWANLPFDDLGKEIRAMENFATSGYSAPDDRFKVSMLLTETLVSIGDIKGAQQLARRSSNDAVFGEWAQRIMEFNG